MEAHFCISLFVLYFQTLSSVLVKDNCIPHSVYKSTFKLDMNNTIHSVWVCLHRRLCIFKNCFVRWCF